MKAKKQTSNGREGLLSRRNFLVATAAAATVSAAPSLAAGQGLLRRKSKDTGGKFKLKYAPRFGQFRLHAGNDLIDQIKFMADEGFRAIFDNGLMRKAPLDQEKIAAELSRQGMDLGPFVAYSEFKVMSFVTRTKEISEMLIAQMKKAIETAKRMNARWCLVVPGCYDDGLEWDYQTANVIENLKRCVEVLEPAGLVNRAIAEFSST